MKQFLIKLGNFLNLLTEDGSLDTTNIIIVLISAKLLIAPELNYGVVSGMVALIVSFSYKHYLYHVEKQSESTDLETIIQQLQEHKKTIVDLKAKVESAGIGNALGYKSDPSVGRDSRFNSN